MLKVVTDMLHPHKVAPLYMLCACIICCMLVFDLLYLYYILYTCIMHYILVLYFECLCYISNACNTFYMIVLYCIRLHYILHTCIIFVYACTSLSRCIYLYAFIYILSTFLDIHVPCFILFVILLPTVQRFGNEFQELQTVQPKVYKV